MTVAFINADHPQKVPEPASQTTYIVEYPESDDERLDDNNLFPSPVYNTEKRTNSKTKFVYMVDYTNGARFIIEGDNVTYADEVMAQREGETQHWSNETTRSVYDSEVSSCIQASPTILAVTRSAARRKLEMEPKTADEQSRDTNVKEPKNPPKQTTAVPNVAATPPAHLPNPTTPTITNKCDG